MWQNSLSVRVERRILVFSKPPAYYAFHQGRPARKSLFVLVCRKIYITHSLTKKDKYQPCGVYIFRLSQAAHLPVTAENKLSAGGTSVLVLCDSLPGTDVIKFENR